MSPHYSPSTSSWLFADSFLPLRLTSPLPKLPWKAESALPGASRSPPRVWGRGRMAPPLAACADPAVLPLARSAAVRRESLTWRPSCGAAEGEWPLRPWAFPPGPGMARPSSKLCSAVCLRLALSRRGRRPGGGRKRAGADGRVGEGETGGQRGAPAGLGRHRSPRPRTSPRKGL